ncbi:hypothetical protein NM688_g5183 [Phlebia brevispora]|uniref:Uncharacterized protein n=1 Tax=Phlebia brevispora TaxID=194682 RepID=A0ACC1SZV2_9APHY|nr:hypothetical protein NM688_g5183 [Phlebia brevispora]
MSNTTFPPNASQQALTPGSDGLRARVPWNGDARRPSVHGALNGGPPPPLTALQKQRIRIRQFQEQWKQIKEDLPPQLSRRHIGMISIGGVIGTGLFVGSADALYHGGPVGALLGYSVVGTVVYCLCVSIGEMIAFLPNVGGVVGLADLYVDRALGFSLGWAAWYNWSVTLPAEISAAASLLRHWHWSSNIPVPAISAVFLAVATLINCFSSGVYGEFEFWLSTFKVFVIICISTPIYLEPAVSPAHKICKVLCSFLVDLGVGKSGFVGFYNWKHPGPFAQYLNIQGPLGRVLGFWAVLMQASFSFFGSEVPGIAAGEVIDATRNVPRALRRVWLRITLFYILGVFCAGLIISRETLVQYELGPDATKNSAFVLAFEKAGWRWLGSCINVAILLSAWSAAASDIYIASRFLFFLARRFHAPRIFATLIRYPYDPNRPGLREQEEEDILDQEDDELPPPVPAVYGRRREDSSSSNNSAECIQEDNVRSPPLTANEEYEMVPIPSSSSSSVGSSDPESTTPPRRREWFVLPLYAVIASAAVGGLSFIDSGHLAVVFNWLVAVASIASLQSWSGMLFTYIRWYQGTVYAEKKARVGGDDDSAAVLENIRIIKQNRHRGQPYLAIYAFSLCMIILLTNGWAVFVSNSWTIAEIPRTPRKSFFGANGRVPTPVLQFLSSYVPIPFFVLLTFGYKLIHQTKMVPVEEMPFSDRGDVPPPEEEPAFHNPLSRLWGSLFVI